MTSETEFEHDVSHPENDTNESLPKSDLAGLRADQAILRLHALDRALDAMAMSRNPAS